MSSNPKIWQYTTAAVLLWSVFIGASLFWNIQSINSEVVIQTDLQAQEKLRHDLAILLWSTQHGGIYLHVDKDTKPNPFLSNVPQRDLQTSAGKLTLQNPAATLREINEKHEELFNQKSHVTSFTYLNPNNAPDEWEKKALSIVTKTKQDYSEVISINGNEYLRRMQPYVLAERCEKCHVGTGIKVGEALGGMDVAIPLQQFQHTANQLIIFSAEFYTAILFIGYVMIGYISNLSKRWAVKSEQYHNQLEQLAYFDPLTGLTNRRRFYEQAEQELIRAIRHDRPLSILMIDIDEFKMTNDLHGHSNGDKTLQKLSDVFRQVVREIDIVCRMGGEEFAILLTETEQSKAMEVAERLRFMVEKSEVALDYHIVLHTTISIGVATLSKDVNSIDGIIKLADSALYEAKRTGRNKVCMAN